MLNFINQLDSPSYFHFFYHETFLPSQQDQVINDLTTHPDTLIVIQQPGIIEPHAKDQHLRFPKLMKALETLGNPVASTPGFLIRFY